MTDTPSAALSKKATRLLVDARLLRADKSEAVAAKIATGAMTESDWKNEIDLAVEKASLT